MNSSSLTGLFLGAGASAELGMPLVAEITSSLKDWLTPAKLRAFNQDWHRQGNGMSDIVIEDFITVLVRSDMHYEALLGYIETQFRRATPQRSNYHRLYAWFVGMISHLLRIRHTELVGFIAKNITLLEGIASLAEANAPLWVFSLNHDVIVECVAAQFDIPLHSGFSDGIVSFPRRDVAGNVVGQLLAETLIASHLERGTSYPSAGTRGINLLKIHGALDIFTFRNGADTAKLLPPERSVTGIIEMLRMANQDLVYVDPRLRYPVAATNEIAYADEAGEMQFLRRSILAGAYKFDNRQSQVLPLKVLTSFETNLDHITKLLCIGYSFGDLHINHVIRTWLESSTGRRLEIVSPNATSVPNLLGHLSPQVTTVPETASRYLDREAGIVRSTQELLERRLAAWLLKNKSDAKARLDFQKYIEARKQYAAKTVLAKINSLPFRNGDVDWDCLGQTPDEFRQSLENEGSAVYQAALTDFLNSIESKQEG